MRKPRGALVRIVAFQFSRWHALSYYAYNSAGQYLHIRISTITVRYISHTLFQEQSGVYGSIVIESKEKTLRYDDDLVLVISD